MALGLSQEPLDRADLGLRDQNVLVKRSLLLRRLVLEVVALARVPAQDLPCRGDLELLLRSRLRFHLRHLFLSPRFWSARAPWSCCDLRGAAGTRSSRAP